jgi:hypothetical protein
VGNFPALLLTFRFRQSLQTFIVILSNNYHKISGNMGSTIEDKALIIINILLYIIINNRFFDERLAAGINPPMKI